MKIVSFWNRVANPVENGEQDFAPSITRPDLAYDLKQLVEEYSIDALPPMALLQPLFDDNEDMVDDDYMAALRGADRADRSLIALQNTKLRDEIIDKVKKMHDWRKKRDELSQQKQEKTEPAKVVPSGASEPPTE